jgi:hypothetical protein
MNAKTKSLNLRSPVFVEPSGIDPQTVHTQRCCCDHRDSGVHPKIRAVTGLTSIEVRGRATNEPYLVKSTNAS